MDSLQRCMWPSKRMRNDWRTRNLRCCAIIYKCWKFDVLWRHSLADILFEDGWTEISGLFRPLTLTAPQQLLSTKHLFTLARSINIKFCLLYGTSPARQSGFNSDVHRKPLSSIRDLRHLLGGDAEKTNIFYDVLNLGSNTVTPHVMVIVLVALQLGIWTFYQCTFFLFIHHKKIQHLRAWWWYF